MIDAARNGRVVTTDVDFTDAAFGIFFAAGEKFMIFGFSSDQVVLDQLTTGCRIRVSMPFLKKHFS